MPESEGIKTSINNVMRNIKGRKITAGDIISHLNFGIWKHILKERSDNKDPLYFWSGVVHEIFPNTTNKKEVILQTLGSITKIRNRLFHYEPLWETRKKNSTIENALQDIRKKYIIIYDFISWLSSPFLQIYMNSYTLIFDNFLKFNKSLHSDLAQEFKKNPSLAFMLRDKK